MRIAFDISPLKNYHQFRGIGTYTRDLIAALKRVDKKNEYLLISGNRDFKQQSFDVLHYPYFDYFKTTLPFKKSKPTVVTIYDVIPLIFPQYFPAGLKGRISLEVQKRSLKGVKAVITISKNSKKDIIKYLNLPEEKIFVTYLAAGESFRQIKSEPNAKFPKNFILYVGDVNWNKNVSGLIQAMLKVKPEISLVLVGKAFKNRALKETNATIQLIKELNLSDRIKLLGYLSEEELVSVYNLATVYCQPSFYEGFGLPVLEAMACGCPVVAANTASLPEICGEAALLVDPKSDNIAQGLNKIINDQSLKSELIRRGWLQVKKFNWEQTARQTLSIYNQVYVK